jgi:hypothetical protein
MIPGYVLCSIYFMLTISWIYSIVFYRFYNIEFFAHIELGQIIPGYQFLMASFLTFNAIVIVKIITGTKMRFLLFHFYGRVFEAADLLADANGHKRK